MAFGDEVRKLGFDLEATDACDRKGGRAGGNKAGFVDGEGVV